MAAFILISVENPIYAQLIHNLSLQPRLKSLLKNYVFFIDLNDNSESCLRIYDQGLECLESLYETSKNSEVVLTYDEYKELIINLNLFGISGLVVKEFLNKFNKTFNTTPLIGQQYRARLDLDFL